MNLQLDPNGQRIVNDFWQKMVTPLENMNLALGDNFKFVHICRGKFPWSPMVHCCVIDQGADAEYADDVFAMYFAPLKDRLNKFFKWCEGALHDYKVVSIHISYGDGSELIRGIKINAKHRRTDEDQVFTYEVAQVPVYA